MIPQTLWVPYSVLNTPTLSASTRLVWILLSSQSAAPASQVDKHLHKLSGLSLPTIIQARSRLVQTPLVPCSVRTNRAYAAVPWALITSAEISAGARLLYGQLQGVTNFAHQSGSFTYASLAVLTGSSKEALRRATAELVGAGWLSIAQANRKSPISFTLRNPVGAQLAARIGSVRRKVRGAQHRGEALLREFLNVMIDLDQHQNDASPDFLVNPYTGELMDLDRFYPSVSVAVEFNGDQHYEKNDLASFEKTVKLIGRDAMKAFICKESGIELVVARPEDLNLKRLEQLLPGRLPRRNLEGVKPLVAALEALASEYRERTDAERSYKDRSPGNMKLGSRQSR